jgi:hypothetical protein
MTICSMSIMYVMNPKLIAQNAMKTMSIGRRDKGAGVALTKDPRCS